MEPGEAEGEHDQVQQVEHDEIEGPSDHVFLRVEDIEYEDSRSHGYVDSPADRVADRVAATHLGIELVERLVDLLGAYSCQVTAKIHGHPQNQGNRDRDDHAQEVHADSQRHQLEDGRLRDVHLQVEGEDDRVEQDVERRVEVHEQQADVARGDLARLSNEADPQVVLELLIEEAHLRVRIHGIVLHGHRVVAPGSVAKPAWHTEDLLPGSFFVLFPLLLGELLVDFDLRGLQVPEASAFALSLLAEDLPASLPHDVLAVGR